MSRRFASLAVLLLAACGSGGGTGGPAPSGAAPLVLAAGLSQIDPVAPASWSAGVDVARLGLEGGEHAVGQVFELTTPAGVPFAFDATSTVGRSTGPVRLSLAHVLADGAAPVGGPESLATAGILPTANGAATRGPWLDAHGDGFVRLGLRGTIEQDQVLAIEAEGDGERSTALVRIRVGPYSRINLPPESGSDHPGLKQALDVYSSDSWAFGLPAVGISGDRASIVVYEGDRVDPWSGARYELRMQVDLAGEAVTGGASPEPSPDTGYWRDHEVAALYNVLATITGGIEQATLRLSFDRGATFGQTVLLGAPSASWEAVRLVQIAMALDYSMAVLFWQGSSLFLVEGEPSLFDEVGSPAQFAFGVPQLVHLAAGEVSPLLMAATYSAGGDLVLGYGFSSFESGPEATWISTTQFRCATRRFGESAFLDVWVDGERLVGRDPSVSVLGQGDSLRIFYAYEASDGVRLCTSEDGGATFSAPLVFGGLGAYAPSVFARVQEDALRLDVLYIAEGVWGSELHVRNWPDFALDPTGETYRLTTSRQEGAGSPPESIPSPGIEIGFGGTTRVTSLAWFGYDAVLDGDDVVVAVHEQTWEAFAFLDGARASIGGLEGAPVAGDAGFEAAEPPPLAPGLTEPLPPVDPLHRNQLRCLRLD